jgi:large repetitive protein
MTKKTSKIILGMVGILFLLAGAGVGVYLVQQQQDVRQKAFQAGGNVEMTLNADSTSLQPGAATEISVMLDTKQTDVKNIQAFVSFPKDSGFTASNPSPNPAIFINNDKWTITSFTTVDEGNQTVVKMGALYASTNSYATTQPVVFAHFTLTAPQTAGATVSLQFDQNNSEVRSNTGDDVLGTIRGTSVTVAGSANPTATPTQGAQPSLTPTTGANPSQTPTPSATGTALQPSATPTRIASATPTSGSNNNNNSGSNNNNSGNTGNQNVPPGTAIAVTSPVNGAIVTTSRPIFRGTAAAGARITITINSADVVTGLVTANSAGAWTWTTSRALANGGHIATLTAFDLQDRQTTATVNFTVNAAGGRTMTGTGSRTATSSGTLPVAGNEIPTLAFLLSGLIFLLAGSLGYLRLQKLS